MAEFGIASLLLAVLLGLSAAYRWFEWEVTLVGLVLVVLGALLGLPTGTAYHVALYRAVIKPRGEKWTWLLWPHRYHVHFTPQQRQRVMRWFFWGAAGFVLIILGCALVALGAYRATSR